MDKHPPKVTLAIRAALNDINLLRALVLAPDSDVNAVLTNYDPRLTLDGGELAVFVNSLRHGKIELYASDLVNYYDGLQPPKIVRGDIRQEWTP